MIAAKQGTSANLKRGPRRTGIEPICNGACHCCGNKAVVCVRRLPNGSGPISTKPNTTTNTVAQTRRIIARAPKPSPFQVKKRSKNARPLAHS